MSATTTELTVTITFDSDWRIGTGSSRSKRVDRSVLTDSLGLPYVPSTSVVGVLRARAEQLAEGLDGGPQGPWWGWVEFVFGSQPNKVPATASHVRPRPRSAALNTAPLYLDEQIRNLVTAARVGHVTGRDIARAATLVRAGIAIDPKTGTVKPDHFRIDEVARAGLTVTGNWTLNAPNDDSAWPAHFLLGAAAQLTASIGGRRRRGLGESQVTFDQYDRSTIAAQAERVAAGEELPALPREDVRPTITTITGTGLRHAHDLRVRLLQPTVVSGSVTANVIDSAAVIPGAVLLPIVLRALNFPDLVRDARIVVTEATPEYNNQRSLLIARNLALPKGTKEGDAVDLTREHVVNPKLKVDNAYAVLGSGTAIVPHWGKVQRLHAVVEDTNEGPDNLYVTNALAAGTVLRAQVWVPDGVELPVNSFDGKDLRIGYSRKDDYGRVEITIEEPDTPADRTEEIPAGEPFAVRLESDVVILGERGTPEPTPSVLVAELNKRLPVSGHTLSLLTTPHATFTPGQRPTVRYATRADTNRIDSWQTRWQLPRPTVATLAAGSVILLESDQLLTAADIALLAGPIGLRIVEGFGRIRIERRHPTRTVTITREKPPLPPGSVGDPEDIDDTIPEAALPLVLDALRVHIANRVIEIGEGKVSEYLPEMRSTQLGVLRGLIESLDTGRVAFNRWAGKVATIERRAGWAQKLPALRSIIDEPAGAHIWTALFGPGAATPPGGSELAEFARKTFLLHLIDVQRKKADS